MVTGIDAQALQWNPSLHGMGRDQGFCVAKTSVVRLGQPVSMRDQGRGNVVSSQVDQARLIGERALFFADGTAVTDSVFADGESPLKHARGVTLDHVIFEWKYPLWYSSAITADRCVLAETARSGIWYADGVAMSDCLVAAPKTFRRAKRIRLNRVDLPNAQETLWGCSDVRLEAVSARGDYFAMNSTGVQAKNLRLTGNYAFDGCSDVEVVDSTLASKDAFWNCHDVVVRDSTIIGEYLGWNSTNLTFINCTIESLQGLCYVDNLVMRDCHLINTTLAFEYSSVDVIIDGAIGSVINPNSGVIKADSIGELILDPERIDPGLTRIILTDSGDRIGGDPTRC
ncbi:MAG: DUF3737 family protein [Propionibacteriaceae bacterium]|jgi:hypothetical protein|nr:DUF3737 family protein [Propionibacteriaceae bacterium]